MASITPVTSLPSNGSTSGAVQITATGVRVSARSTAGTCTLALIRMDGVSGNWFRYTYQDGSEIQMNLSPAGSNNGSEDYSFTLPAAAANEYYHLLLEGGSSFTGVAEIENASAPPAAGGTVPQSRTFTPSNGITLDGGTSAVDLSADRAIAFNTAIATCTTSAVTLASGVDLAAAGGVSNIDFSASSGTIAGPTGLSTFNGDLLMAAAKVVGFGAPQALSGAGAVNVTTLVTMFTSTGAAQALTLANGTRAGQLKIVCHAVDGGSGVLTPATPSGFATLTLTNLYDAGVMMWDGSAWRAILATGAAAFA